MSVAKRVALGGLLVALALGLAYAESLFPPPVPSVPGIKLGLSNIVTLVVLYSNRVKRPATSALCVLVLRVLLAGLMFTGIWAMLYSLTGAALSFIVMVLLKRLPFSVIGVSIAGGVAHNMAQLCFAAITLSDVRLMYYYPVLILAGIAAGAITGIIAVFIVDK